jgi:hypothetical protein
MARGAGWVAIAGVVVGAGCRVPSTWVVADAGADAEVGPPVPRLIAPLSTATVTRQRPTLRWKLPEGVTQAHVEIYRDRAASMRVVEFDGGAESGQPPVDLPPGVVFWRVRARGTNGSEVTTPTWQFTVPHRSAASDTSWGSTPDVNGDGVADVVVASNDRPKLYVYHSPVAGSAVTPTAIIETIADVNVVRPNLATAGDVNGDGWGDVVVQVGGPRDNGAAAVLLGGSSGLDRGRVVLFLTPSDVFRTTGGGDLNRDGFADIMVWSPNRLDVFLGGPAGPRPNPSATITLPSDTDVFGGAARFVGDTDGDGFEDAVVGVPNRERGSVYVYRGSPHGLLPIPVTTLAEPLPASGFGSAVGAGDLNGDGHPDLVVGAPSVDDGRGRVFVYYGGASGFSTTPSLTLAPPERPFRGGAFGYPVEVVGDLNGDGFEELVVSAIPSEELYVFAGRPTGLDSAPAVTVPEPSGMTTNFGNALAGARDMNGDGISDFLVGDYSASDFRGQVHLYLGAMDNLPTRPAVTLIGRPSASFGVSVACLIPASALDGFESANGPSRLSR